MMSLKIKNIITQILFTGHLINTLQPSIAYLYPLKISEKPTGGIDKQQRVVVG